MQGLQVGKIVNTHGLNGMVKVYPYTNVPQDFERFTVLYRRADLTGQLEIKQIKYHKQLVIIKFKGLDRIDDVLPLKQTLLYADKALADSQLAEDEYYIEDLIGATVVDGDGRSLGVVAAFRDGAQQVVLEVDHAGHLWFLPFVDAFVKSVDQVAGVIQVSLIEGMYGED